MTALDLLYLAFIAVILCVDRFVLWPAFLRRSETESGWTRPRLWSAWIVILWTMTAGGAAVWSIEARPWGALRLVPPHGWRLWVAIGLAVVLAIAQARTAVTVARTRRGRRIKMGNPNVEKYSPHTRSELGWWIAVSLSAGFCEEFIFRGYLIWAFEAWLGLWGAAALSVVIFALAHSYQGANGIVSVGMVGALFTVVALTLGSLWPAIALHAILDIGQGFLAWVVFRRTPGEAAVPA